MQIAEIKIGKRHRKNLGDVDALARSIQEVGLLHPVVVRQDGTLIVGERRLEAVKQLGWTEVPATIAVNLEDALSALKAERDENVCRQNFTPTEAVALGERLEGLIKAAAKQRQAEQARRNQPQSKSKGGKFPPFEKMKARDEIGEVVGMSGKTYEKAKAVMASGNGQLIEQMDRTGKVDRAFKELKRQEILKRNEAAVLRVKGESDRFRLICGDFKSIENPGPVDGIITDPPYGDEILTLARPLAIFARDCLKPGGSLIVMLGQFHLPKVMAEMIGVLDYHWLVAYLTPGGQSPQIFPRRVNTFWKPVLWLTKGKYAGPWVGDVSKSGENDKRFHEWGQSESGMADLVERFSIPGQTILDPCCGAGTTGIVAVQLGRKFIGIDVNHQTLEVASGRLSAISV